MEKSYSYIQKKQLDQMSLNGASVRYGQQPDIAGYWKTIVECDSKTARETLISKLLEKMEENSEQNGFWGSQEELRITFGIGANSIHLDDKNIYFSFFENLRNTYLDSKEKGIEKPEGTMAVNSIYTTIENYFGAFNGDLDKRLELTELDFDTFEYPSVEVLKGQGCGACVEKAAVAHNLWLLMGRESYYACSTSAKFENSSDEGHAFCMIKNQKGNFMLYDHAMGNFGALQGDPVETLLSGQPLIIGQPFQNHGVYANACNLEQNVAPNE